MSDLTDRVPDANFILFVRVFSSGQAVHEVGWQFRAAHRSDPLNLLDVRYGHDAGNDWNLNARGVATVAKPQKLLVIEKQLRDDDVGACVDLSLEVLKVHFSTGCFLMNFGIASHCDPKLLELVVNQLDQFVRVTEAAFAFFKLLATFRRISTQSNDIVDTDLRRPIEVVPQIIASAAHECQVRGNWNIKFRFEFAENFERLGLAAAACSIGAGHEVRREAHQPFDVCQ